MTDTLGKIKEFVNYARSLKGYEKGEAQVFCDRLFQAFGHQGCVEAGAKLEYRLKSKGKHTRFPDLVWRPRLLLEMKSRGENLEEHIQQAREYWDELKPQPRYVVLCNFDEFWIYDTTLQIEEPVNRVKLEELPQRYAALDFLFPGNSAVDEHRGNYYENIPPSGAVQLFGREQELERLHQLLTPPAPLIQGGEQQNKLTIAAIVGMGGVGKTELVIQYARQHLQGLDDSAGGVCWVDARDGDVGIQLVNFARSLLNLNPPEDWDLPTQLNYCWRNWKPGDWLIVIDDVTNYRQQVNPYKPPESSQFKVLLTTREELGRPVEHLPLDKLQPETALDLLTSLVGIQRIQQESDIAEKLCQWLDYLPLGLELVGRYLERDLDLSLKAMLSRLEKKRLRHRSVLEADSTMTARLGVADAFELSWERLDEDAQFLGCLLSLFASADIPWELVKQAYSNMPSSENQEIDLDILEEARADLVRFNLLQRTGEGTYRLHQLIREFLLGKRKQSAQENDLKQAFVAAILAVAEQIPDKLTLKHIQEAAPAMPHVAEVANNKYLRNLLTDENLMSPFVGLSRFYESQGLYDPAVAWSEQCLFVTQIRVGLDHSQVALSMNNLGTLYFAQGRYKEAETLFLKSLQLTKPFLEKDNHQLEMAWGDWARTLNNLAMLYYEKGRYSEAKLLYKKSLKLHQLLGNDHPLIATSLNNLAMLYSAQGRYIKAEPLYLQALEIRKRQLGDEHLDVATSLNNLANHYSDLSYYDKAESLYLQSLAIYERHVSDKYPNVPATLSNLGSIYISQRRYSQAEPVLIKALELDKQLLGEDHPGVATSLSNLATLYYVQQRYQEGEPLLVQALEIYERCLGSNHPSTVENRKVLANLRDRLNSTARDLPNFNQKANKGNSKKKPKGFG
jgi:tetratricopeptide (TPR) repeat protein